ncbi:MAG TPA: hypothetical protein VJ998_10070 [Pseudomonadales bacterium]|nr:hypothetical protein [Pseudomonadales bacterium]
MKIARLICWFRGHRYEAPVLDGNSLCFCRRCSKEIADGSFEDLEPIDPADLDCFDLDIGE